MKPGKALNDEIVKKYQLAGKIRFLSFTLLLLFLFLMKSVGGYSYLNGLLITLILVEAILNQPYRFILKRVNIDRFQYYQMATDIIAISWVLHYMGGIEAPLITIAYYAVILWAGVASTSFAVFFAVTASAFFFFLIVVLGHFGILPFVSYYNYKMPTAQMFSLLLGNISFLFAFGYFSAYSSSVLKTLQRKKQEESLRNVHKFMATGYLIGNTAHDILNCLASIRGYVKILLSKIKGGGIENEMLNSIEKLEKRSSDLLYGLSSFSKKGGQEFIQTDVTAVIESALKLSWPLLRYIEIDIKKIFAPDTPEIPASSNQLQEVFVALILNSLDAMPEKGQLTIKTTYDSNNKVVKITFSDTGKGIKPENLKRIGEAFFSTKGQEKGLGLGLATAYGIIAKHKGKISVDSTLNKGTTITIQLPTLQ